MFYLTNLINWWCFCFGCDGWCVLYSSPCLLVYENAPASSAAR